VAVRLTPPYYPFEVVQLRYEVQPYPEGASIPAHKVQAAVGQTDAPPDTPDVLASFDMPEYTGDEPFLEHELDLDTPIKLEQGDQLFVMVEQVTEKEGLEAGGKTGIRFCGNTSPAGRNFTAINATPPFFWYDQKDKGNYYIEALGK
jgi:hypothetical protein